MICIHCGVDSKYKDRRVTPGHCPVCKRPFAFEPRAGAPITDLGFKNAIDAVSARGHVSWGVENLYYEVCRRLGRTPGELRGIRRVAVGVAAGVAFFTLFHGAWTWTAGAVAVGVLAYLWPRLSSRLTGRRFVRLSRAEFDRMWATWTRVHGGGAKGLIVRKDPVPRPRAPEPDIPLYSFDRAVICDRARTVDLLLANNFHFENNCAVLSIDGYPPGPFATVLAMLKRNPRLDVFALHDATAAGCRMAHRLTSDDQWFKGRARVVDVGLRPVHARSFQGILLPAAGGPVRAGAGISAEEARWLSSHVLELAAIRPEQVLKRLYRAINAAAVKPRRRADRRDGPDSGGSGDGGGPGWDTVSTVERGGEFGGAGASDDFWMDGDSFASDAGDADGDGDGGSG